jgi:hypothetical protein
MDYQRPGRKRKLQAPVQINIILDANTVKALDRQAVALSKKYGFNIFRGEIIREVLENYLKVAGV